ncbi:MAG: hypothetical protein ACPG5U_11100 [Planktomarina sp.]
MQQPLEQLRPKADNTLAANHEGNTNQPVNSKVQFVRQDLHQTYLVICDECPQQNRDTSDDRQTECKARISPV